MKNKYLQLTLIYQLYSMHAIEDVIHNSANKYLLFNYIQNYKASWSLFLINERVSGGRYQPWIHENLEASLQKRVASPFSASRILELHHILQGRQKNRKEDTFIDPMLFACFHNLLSIMWSSIVIDIHEVIDKAINLEHLIANETLR